ncbi:MAG TPA: hypothetical protein VFX58_09920, partial [Chitinophagaceae bacterium]|nr:hypothetical protein [Chitinophagaceae bacterium]
AYTNAREKILNRLLKKHISSSPGYYIQTRIYTAARIWFTGINKEELQKASFMGKLKLLYPFLVTFTCIFGGLITVLILIFKRILSWKIYWPLFLLIGYFGLIHIPFAIQARYTVPVHMFILFLLSAGIATLAVDKTVKA